MGAKPWDTVIIGGGPAGLSRLPWCSGRCVQLAIGAAAEGTCGANARGSAVTRIAQFCRNGLPGLAGSPDSSMRSKITLEKHNRAESNEEQPAKKFARQEPA